MTCIKIFSDSPEILSHTFMCIHEQNKYLILTSLFILLNSLAASVERKRRKSLLVKMSIIMVSKICIKSLMLHSFLKQTLLISRIHSGANYIHDY